MITTAVRTKLPKDRNSLTHKFNVGGHRGIITVGLYNDGSPGELFITIAKAGSTLCGLMDSFAIMASMALQYGVPLEKMCEKMIDTNFQPNGWSTNAAIGHAKSLMDYIFRWMEIKFIVVNPSQQQLPLIYHETSVNLDAPTCTSCGALMRTNGNCYVCSSCGTTSGCS